MKKSILLFLISSVLLTSAYSQEVIDKINVFIGTSNYGATNPGAVLPNGMMSVSPFNVMGSNLNRFDKDARWWSMPYEYNNKYLTGFSHVNLSGVGCPDLAGLLLMPTSGDLFVDYKQYGSEFSNEKASPGYYSNFLTKYNIKTEVSATKRSSIARFTFPEGQANILMNLGEGLTNESGAWMRRVSDTEVEGMKLMGTFCYNPQAVFPIYFVMRVSKQPKSTGYWKMQRETAAWEKEWDIHSGQYKIYTRYGRDIAGDDIGAWFTYEVEEGETIEVQIGVSFVSAANARMNLEAEQQGFNFDKVHANARQVWNEALAYARIEGGTPDQQAVFYTGLYHALIHPNILNDVNGEYPAMESDKILRTDGTRYTVFSLWDTYRCVHQLLTLLYPEKQLDMVRSMIDMYRESGWLPKWELYSRETLVMEGDPAFSVINDTWQKGLRDFDVETAYQAMYKSATMGEGNFIRPQNADYLKYGFIPLRERYDHSISQALECYVADAALARFAESLGKTADAERFRAQSLNYRKYFCPEYKTFRPILPDGTFLAPFNPAQGTNFEPVPGFHEGNAFNYSFSVPHDVPGMIEMYGGTELFVKHLQAVFDDGHYDPSNQPNISYPFLFSYIPGEEWRTQKITQEVLANHFKNSPDGLPGNDDTGTMSSWAVFSMMGFYPDNATDPSYTFTTPVFDRVTLTLDERFHNSNQVIIETVRPNENAKFIDRIEIDGQRWDGFRISHKDLMKADRVVFYLKEK
jgi:predicted alpha-1,2-mannosidase